MKDLRGEYDEIIASKLGTTVEMLVKVRKYIVDGFRAELHEAGSLTAEYTDDQLYVLALTALKELAP